MTSTTFPTVTGTFNAESTTITFSHASHLGTNVQQGEIRTSGNTSALAAGWNTDIYLITNDGIALPAIATSILASLLSCQVRDLPQSYHLRTSYGGRGKAYTTATADLLTRILSHNGDGSAARNAKSRSRSEAIQAFVRAIGTIVAIQAEGAPTHDAEIIEDADGNIAELNAKGFINGQPQYSAAFRIEDADGWGPSFNRVSGTAADLTEQGYTLA